MTEINHQPYFTRKRQDFAIANERQKHKQALYSHGEPVLFTLMWKVEDFEAGLVDKCPRCFADPDSIETKIQNAYRQPIDARCPACYGTTFFGGIRAQIIRPAIISDADEDETISGRGRVHSENVQIESTDDFRARTGDYLFRRDGSRWELGRPTRLQLRTGYEHPEQETTSVGYARIPGARLDKTQVAYDIPPTADELSYLLDVHGFFPEKPLYEQQNGPLIPTHLETE